MSAIDLGALLEPVSEDSPSGDPIEYEPEYLELEILARGVAQEEDADGKVVREAEEPDWREVERICLGLCAKAKDLRVAIYLARAELALYGLPGLRDGLALIGGYIGTYWPSVHPQLDPDDNNDPAIRVNSLASLCHTGSIANETVMRELRMAPLTQSRQFGRISYRDFAIANGLMPPPPKADADQKLPDQSQIEAALSDSPIDALRETRQAAAEAREHVGAIDSGVTDAIGAGNGPDFGPLEKLLRDIGGMLDAELAKRGGGEVAEAAAEGGGEAEISGSGVAGGGTGGAIRNRDDVLLLLDRICRYYSDHEPSSPVPLLLERTKRLVKMNFLDILKDLTPGGVQEFGMIAGIREEEQ